jgi:hypothetical protein
MKTISKIFGVFLCSFLTGCVTTKNIKQNDLSENADKEKPQVVNTIKQEAIPQMIFDDEVNKQRQTAFLNRELAIAGYSKWRTEGEVIWELGQNKGSGKFKLSEVDTDFATMFDFSPELTKGGLAFVDGSISFTPVEGNEDGVGQKEMISYLQAIFGKKDSDYYARSVAWLKGVRFTKNESIIFHANTGLPWRMQEGGWSVYYDKWHTNGAFPLPAQVVFKKETLTVTVKLTGWGGEKNVPQKPEKITQRTI